MTTLFCIITTALALICVPLMILLHVTETPKQKARRWRKSGMTFSVIGKRLGVSATTSRRWALS